MSFSVFQITIVERNVENYGKKVDNMAEVRKRMIFHGRVQGVGFRYTAKYLAQSMKLTGWVRNDPNGTVTMEIQGRITLIHKVMEGLNRSNFINIEWIDSEDIPIEKESCFLVR